MSKQVFTKEDFYQGVWYNDYVTILPANVGYGIKNVCHRTYGGPRYTQSVDSAPGK